MTTIEAAQREGFRVLYGKLVAPDGLDVHQALLCTVAAMLAQEREAVRGVLAASRARAKARGDTKAALGYESALQAIKRYRTASQPAR